MTPVTHKPPTPCISIVAPPLHTTHCSFADNVATGTHVSMELIVMPLLALATQIAERPSVRELPQWFYQDVPKLLLAVPKRVGLYSLQVAPQGVVTAAYPRVQNARALGIDIFRGEAHWREGRVQAGRKAGCAWPPRGAWWGRRVQPAGRAAGRGHSGVLARSQRACAGHPPHQ